MINKMNYIIAKRKPTKIGITILSKSFNGRTSISIAKRAIIKLVNAF